MHEYEVTVVLHNDACNQQPWNDKSLRLFMCPDGFGCRLDLSKQAVKLYPNPAHDEITLSGLIELHPNDLQLKIFNANGTVVYDQRFIDSTVDIDALPAGLYSIVVYSSTKLEYSSKLVVK